MCVSACASTQANVTDEYWESMYEDFIFSELQHSKSIYIY